MNVYLKNLIHPETRLLASDETQRDARQRATAFAQLGCDAQLIKCSLELLAHNAGRTASAGQDNAFRVGSRVSLIVYTFVAVTVAMSSRIGAR